MHETMTPTMTALDAAFLACIRLSSDAEVREQSESLMQTMLDPETPSKMRRELEDRLRSVGAGDLR